MKLNIPPIVRPLSLSEYAPEMGDVEISVWVNPPRAVLAEYFGIIQAISAALKLQDAERAAAADKAGSELMGWLARIWSAGDEDTRWDNADVQALWENCIDTDPGLWAWLTSETWRMIEAHRADAKKK